MTHDNKPVAYAASPEETVSFQKCFIATRDNIEYNIKDVLAIKYLA